MKSLDSPKMALADVPAPSPSNSSRLHGSGGNVEMQTSAPVDIVEILFLLSRPRSTACWAPYLNVSLRDQLPLFNYGCSGQEVNHHH
jgi:hypothetical protein